MIAVDTNLLVYAHRQDAPFHEPASAAVRELAEGAAAWALPWPCLHEFLALVTHPRIFDPPTPMAEAAAQVEPWIEAPSVVLLAEGRDHWRSLRSLLLDAAITGPTVHDARIAAICIGNGVRTLWTVDRDFSRFPGLSVANPLRA